MIDPQLQTINKLIKIYERFCDLVQNVLFLIFVIMREKKLELDKHCLLLKKIKVN